jgi:hypothetical protein
MFDLFKRRDDDVDAFWRWFGKNAARIREGVERQDQGVIIHELGARIAKAAPGVVHEIGKPDDGTVELVFSADGVRAGIPGVLALAKSAPRLDGFLFTAFRPRHPGFGLRINGETVTADDLAYVSRPGEGVLHVAVFVPGDRDERARTTIGFLLLDQVLGEHDVMTGLGRIDFVSEPLEGARPLSALAAEFDAFRAATAH